MRLRDWRAKTFQPTPEPERLNESDLRRDLADRHSFVSNEPLDKEVELTEILFNDWKKQLVRWLSNARDDVKFYEGEHWKRADKVKLEKKGNKPIAIQIIFQAVELALSMLAARDPEFRVTPKEDSDRKRGHLRSYLLQWIWHQSKQTGFQFKTALKDYYTRGRGFLYIYLDPDGDMGKGEVRIRTLDPDYVIVPPNTKSPLYDDADHIMMVSFLTAAQIKERWPKVNVEMLNSSYQMQYQSIWTQDISNNEEYKKPEKSLFGLFNRQFGDEPITNPLDFQSTESRPYAVFERFTKVRRQFYAIVDPQDPFAEEIHDQKDFQLRVQMTAFILLNEKMQRVVIDQQEVQGMEQLFIELGGIPDPEMDTQVHYHFVQGLPDPQTGQPGEPVMKPGPPGPGALPETHHILIRSTIQRIIQRKLLSVRPFGHTRIRHNGHVGTQKLWDGYDLPTSHYPVIPILNSHNRHPYPQGDITRVKDIQEMYNKTMSLVLAHTASNAGPKILIPSTSTMNKEELEDDWAQAGAKVIVYDPDPNVPTGGIQVVHPGPLNTSLYQLLETLRALIQEILGIYTMQQGDSSLAPETYRGTLALDEFGSRRTKSKREDIYMSIQRGGKVALDFATVVYDPNKVIRVVNSNGDQTIFTVQDYSREAQNFPNPLVNEYDVIVVAGSTLPSNRWAELEQKLQMFQAGLLDHEAVLKSTDIPDAEGILERMGLVQNLERQNQELKRQGMDLIKELDKMRKALEEEAQGDAAEKFSARLEILLEKEKAKMETDDEINALEMKQQKQLMDMERKHQKELMQMERQIRRSKQAA